jgi:carboxymethylenebutenolidase
MSTGVQIELTSPDGHRFAAYRNAPAGASLGGVVVLQEIFGVNAHIRSICDRLTAEGFATVAPALFDRRQRDFELGYTDEDIGKGKVISRSIPFDEMMVDVQTAVSSLSEAGPVSVIGFCMGGSLAYLAAARFENVASAVGFYGARVLDYRDEVPRVPVQLHYGAFDVSIPLGEVETVMSARPDCDLYIYPAEHGFNCDARASYHPASAAAAWRRTLALLHRAARGPSEAERE